MKASQKAVDLAVWCLVVGTAIEPLRAEPANDARCSLAALTEYQKANVEILLQANPILSVEAKIAQRRLQERYCVQQTRCTLADSNNNALIEMSYRAYFSRCLAEESGPQSR
jgi:hypothetical protein